MQHDPASHHPRSSAHGRAAWRRWRLDQWPGAVPGARSRPRSGPPPGSLPPVPLAKQLADHRHPGPDGTRSPPAGRPQPSSPRRRGWSPGPGRQVGPVRPVPPGWGADPRPGWGYPPAYLHAPRRRPELGGVTVLVLVTVLAALAAPMPAQSSGWSRPAPVPFPPSGSPSSPSPPLPPTSRRPPGPAGPSPTRSASAASRIGGVLRGRPRSTARA